MSEYGNILDAPTIEALPEQARGGYYTVNRFDYGMNILLLAISGLIAIVSIFEQDAFGLILAWNIVLGGYQLLSGLVGAIRGNRKKLYYLIGAVVYVVFAFGLISVVDPVATADFKFVFAVVLFMFLPLVGAVYYTLLCREAKNRSL